MPTKLLEARAKEFFLLIYLLIYLMLSQYSPARDHIYSVEAFFLIFIAGIYYFLVAALRKRIHYRNLNRLPLYLYISALPFLFLSSFFGLDYRGSSELVGAINNLVYQLTFIFFIYFYISKNQFSISDLTYRLSWLLLIYALLSSLAAFQLRFTGGILFGPIYFESNRWPQLYGWFQSPNFFINSIGLGLISAIFLISSKTKPRSRCLLLVLASSLALLVFSAILSGSKGGVLFLSLSIIFSSFLIFLSKIDRFALVRSYYYILLLVIGSILTILFIVYFLEASGQDSRWLFRSVLRVQSIADGSGRISLWIHSLDIIRNADFYQLVFGHGNNYIISSYGASTHNAHLKIIIEYGIFVYLILVILFFYVMLSAIKLVRSGYRSIGFFVSCILFFAWFRTLLNAGLFTAGLLGFSFILTIFIASLKKPYIYENSLSLK